MAGLADGPRAAHSLVRWTGRAGSSCHGDGVTASGRTAPRAGPAPGGPGRAPPRAAWAGAGHRRGREAGPGGAGPGAPAPSRPFAPPDRGPGPGWCTGWRPRVGSRSSPPLRFGGACLAGPGYGRGPGCRQATHRSGAPPQWGPEDRMVPCRLWLLCGDCRPRKQGFGRGFHPYCFDLIVRRSFTILYASTVPAPLYVVAEPIKISGK